MSNTVILCPTLASAIDYAKDNENFVASVEAEYGDVVIKGEYITLAHHTAEYQHCLPPCDIKLAKIYDGVILVSHIDLDTVGGVLTCMGIKPENQSFWDAAGYIDVSGPHNINYISDPLVVKQLQAYWAWNVENRGERITIATDVTDVILKHGEIIKSILDGDKDLIDAGQLWASKILADTQSKLEVEDTVVRVFVTDGVFCSASYYSPRLKLTAKATVVLNTKFNSITIAFEDGGKEHSAKNFVQEMWGNEAGGHAGIAGSPRGQVMTISQLAIAVKKLREKFGKFIN